MRGERFHLVDGESSLRTANGVRRLEAESIAWSDGRRHLDDELTMVGRDNLTDRHTAIVGLGAGDIVTTDAATIHAACEASAVDLDERLHLLRWRHVRL